MRIILDFDTAYLKRRMSQHAAPIFTIAFEHQGEYYPDNSWTDFGAVIIQLWMNALVELCTGSREAEFLFMDGPYSLTLRRDELSTEVQVTSTNPVLAWSVSLEQIYTAVINAATSIAAKLGEIDMDDDYRLGLLHMRKGLENQCPQMASFGN